MEMGGPAIWRRLRRTLGTEARRVWGQREGFVMPNEGHAMG